jgi:hypothetical protein
MLHPKVLIPPNQATMGAFVRVEIIATGKHFMMGKVLGTLNPSTPPTAAVPSQQKLFDVPKVSPLEKCETLSTGNGFLNREKNVDTLTTSGRYVAMEKMCVSLSDVLGRIPLKTGVAVSFALIVALALIDLCLAF